ncbi:MAG: hypothetical protein A2787_01175, partial [Omnitrophica WOR_2 bacterium RIFCSPHIGHO2_01_FULL_48_9]
MFDGKSIFEIIHKGGFVMYVLIACSVVSLTVVVDRLMYYSKKSKVKLADFMQRIRSELQKNRLPHAIEICHKTDTPFAKVARAGLHLHGHSEKMISEAMQREILIESIKLERFTSIIGTIGSTAVYIGLLGTVLGIMRAFHDITLKGSGGISVVIGGISEALISTAAGLVVAIPAVIFYNFFIRKIDNFV